MVDREAVQQAIAQATLEAAKGVVLAVGEEDRKQNMNTEQNGETEATMHRTGPSL